MLTFRQITVRAATKYLRGHISWTESITRKTRGGRFFSEYIQHESKDAIIRHVTEKTVEITLPDGQTFRKQKSSHGFNLYKVRPLMPHGYRILLKKRQCPRNSATSPNPLPSDSSNNTTPPTPSPAP